MTAPLPASHESVDPVSLPRARLVVLFMVMLVTAAGNTAMQSVMPSIGTRLRVDDVWVSLAYSWSAVLWMGFAPFWARRSDRRGRKTMMQLGLIGFMLSFLFCGLVLWAGLLGWISGAATLLLFALARSLYGGFGSAAPPAVQAYVASRTSRSQRTAALSLIASSFGLGTVLGPALAPLLIVPGLGLISPFLIFTLFAVVVLIALRILLPEDDPRYAARGDVVVEPVTASSNSALSSEKSVDQPAADAPRLTWRDPRLRGWLTAGLLGGHAQAMLLGIVGFLLLDRLGLRANPDAAAGPIGLVLMGGAVATLLAQWGLIPMLKAGPRAATIWGIALAAVGVAIVSLAQDLHGIALGFSIASLGFGLFRPGFTAGTSLAVNRAEQGQSAGMVASVNGASYIVAPALGVWLYNHVEWMSFAVTIALCLAVLLLCVRGLDADQRLS